MPTRVIFVDLNSYFASVEQAEDPSLMGKPVAVVPLLADTTCCLAASYPAKARGVRTGTLVKDAKKLCPGIIFVQANHRRYVDYHHRIIEAVERCLPVWRVFSIDEMAIRLYGREQDLKFAHAKALEIKRRIADEVHPALTCSIGIAPNRYLAKIASDMQKPDGLVTIEDHELPHRLFSLKLRDFPGIGPRMEERLVAARCASARTLCSKSEAEMRELWGGIVGENFWKQIHGHDLAERESERGTIGHSRVLGPSSRTPDAAWTHLVALVSKAGMRLREEQFFTQSLQLSLAYRHRPDAPSVWHSRSRFPPTQDTRRLLDALKSLWAAAPKERLVKIGITLSSLETASRRQLDLFDDPKRGKLMSALDTVNKRFGRNSIVLAENSELQREREAPIAFGHIPSEFE